ncbi:MAG: sulfoxide reductase heme-binding subunit YedZ [Gammaproteobacteria bacterium]|nr:sulfoxide reductase heme-binding subunit YedZ [Gammaproteobacteria bacterium]
MPIPAQSLKPLVFVAALIPAALLIAGVMGVANQSLGPNPIREMLHVTGKTALNLLMITLTVSPVRAATGRIAIQGIRRMLGLFCFAYALLHFLVYAVLELDLDFSDLGREIVRRPFIVVGSVALLALIPLAATSTNRLMRKLGRRWQTLHRLIYPITILGVWHYYWQVKADIREPLIYAAVLATLLGFRLWRTRRSTHANTQGGIRFQP